MYLCIKTCTIEHHSNSGTVSLTSRLQVCAVYRSRVVCVNVCDKNVTWWAIYSATWRDIQIHRWAVSVWCCDVKCARHVDANVTEVQDDALRKTEERIKIKKGRIDVVHSNYTHAAGRHTFRPASSPHARQNAEKYNISSRAPPPAHWFLIHDLRIPGIEPASTTHFSAW